MRSREDRILDVIRKHDRAAADAVNRKSISSFFTPLADCLLDSDRGVLAKILPFAACMGSTGEGERRFLADRFEVSIVVTSHARQMNFSDSTTIHECLLVCRRKAGQDRGGTVFVSLSRMPGNAEEAIAVADAIAAGTLGGEWGRCIRWPRSRVEAGDWSPVQWLDGVLAEVAYAMADLSTLRPLRELAHIGPAHVRTEMRNPLIDPSDGPYRVLWRHESDERRTMRSSHEFSVAAKPGKERAAQRSQLKAGRLLVANRLRTTVVHVSAVLLDQPALGSAWTPVRPRKTSRKPLLVQQAWCAWLNSTPGVLAFMHRRGRTLTYPNFMPNKLQSLPCPDPSKADLEPLAKAYQAFREQPLLPWRRMNECPVRAALDDAAADATGLDRHKVADWRRRLSQEPTIRGHGE